MSMHVNLSPEMENFVKSKVETGFYGNATEVIRDALRRMQAEDTRSAAWQAAVKVGDDQLDRGEGIAYTPATLKDITESAISAMHSGTPMDADVLP
jgi:antitoxin ParD1/3/4